MAFNNKRLFFIEVSFSGLEKLQTSDYDLGIYSLISPFKVKKSQLLQKKDKMVEFLRNYTSGNVFRSKMTLKYRIGMIKDGFLRVYAQNEEVERLGEVLYDERIVDEKSIVRFRSYGDVYADVKECFAKAKGRARRQLTDSIDLSRKDKSGKRWLDPLQERSECEDGKEVVERAEVNFSSEEDFPSLV
mgnify:FL=1